MSFSEALQCRYAGICGGCPEIHLPYSSQVAQKKFYVESLFDHKYTVHVHSIETGYLRDRCDLSLKTQNGNIVLGLYNLLRTEIVDLEECLQMSPLLWQAVEKLRRDLPPVSLGSIRIRVSPKGQIGLWLDLPNESVKMLLEEKTWFQRTLKWAQIEIGQKRKKLTFIDEKHYLKEEDYDLWFETYLGKELEPFSIYGKIGGFTQPGFRANKKLIEVIHSILPKNVKNIVELCAGSGNFTFALASLGIHVTAVEVEQSSLKALELSLQKFKFKEHIQIQKRNLHSKKDDFSDLFRQQDIIIADPPRSGLGPSLDSLQKVKDLPKWFLYISCYPESFKQDIEKLNSFGYQIQKIEAVDQFPQSKHLEIISLLERT